MLSLSYIPSSFLILPTTNTLQSDVNDISWRSSIFGPNYEKLLAIKRVYDPDGVFYCKNCVGSERWEERADGSLCQAIGWDMAQPGDGDGDDEELVRL